MSSALKRILFGKAIMRASRGDYSPRLQPVRGHPPEDPSIVGSHLTGMAPLVDDAVRRPLLGGGRQLDPVPVRVVHEQEALPVVPHPLPEDLDPGLFKPPYRRV